MRTREHILYPAIYAAVEALPCDDDISGFGRVRDLLTLLRTPPPPNMMDFHALAAGCAHIYSRYLGGARIGRAHRMTRSEFLLQYFDGAAVSK